jgi:CyaY protein
VVQQIGEQPAGARQFRVAYTRGLIGLRCGQKTPSGIGCGGFDYGSDFFKPVILGLVTLTMTDQEFKVACDRAIEELYKSLGEASNDYEFDPDMNQGALTISFDDPPGRFVVSPQGPVHQIWVSAESKSFKFGWNGSAFVLPDSGETLKQMIAGALSRRLGETVELA